MLPSRLISRLILRPGGISRSMRRNCIGAVDVLAIDGEDDIIDFEPDLAGGRVVVDEGDHGAADILELERLRLVGIDVGDIDAEVAGRAGVGQKRAGILKERRELLRLGVGCGRRDEQTGCGGGQHAQVRGLDEIYGTASKGASLSFLPR